MGSLDGFLGKFGTGGADDTPLDSGLLSASAPNALGAFLDKFTTLTESYWFYNNTIELRFDTDKHKYYKVDPELGNLIEQYGVTTVLKIIDRSPALVPWGCKMMLQKLLRTIPIITDEKGTIWIAPMTLEQFTKIAEEAKGAHKEILEEAGDIGHIAHKCLEESIQYALDNTEDHIVRELRGIPTDEKAAAAAAAAFAWMHVHNVRWIKTEQMVYSKEFEYSGTMDGKALVDSCDDPSCCAEPFKDALSIADWKSSNALHIEYIFQVPGAYRHAEEEEYGEKIQYCFILRLGKNEEEAGKFEPWPIPAKDFPEALEGFLACLNLLKLVHSVEKRMSTQKKGVRETKKAMRAAAKEIAKAVAKVERAKAKAEAKLSRAADRERIKAEAKEAREHAKETVAENVLVSIRSAANPNSIQGSSEGTHMDSAETLVSSVEENTQITAFEQSVEKNKELLEKLSKYEETVEHKPFQIPEETN